MGNAKFLTVSEVAQILGISRVAVFKKIKKGQIKALKIGRNFAIPQEEVLSILGKTLTSSQKKVIEKGVKKVFEDYKTTLKLLGQE
ncbi:MAG: hypothetical protein QG648_132 [Patescibacteria group bacterium]|nr:hypothetical protein [Patescibacteria group bacterium]